jgi:hypothetical protein
MQTKNSTAVTAAIPQIVTDGHERFSEANWLVSESVISHATTNQL